MKVKVLELRNCEVLTTCHTNERMASFWLASAGAPHFTSPTPNEFPEEAHVVIIGGGITGVSTAYWLQRLSRESATPIRSIVLFDQRGICEGATGRNGGHIWPSVRVPQKSMIDQHGPEIAKEITEFDYSNVELMSNFIQEELERRNISENSPTISSDFLNPEFFLTGALDLCTLQERFDLQTNLQQLDSLGIRAHPFGLELWEESQCRTTLPSISSSLTSHSLGVFQKIAGQLWPARFVALLLHRIQSPESLPRVSIHTHTKVLRVFRSTLKPGWSVVECENGRSLQAQIVVYATNAWTPLLLPQLKSVIKPVRGQVLVTSPIPVEICKGDVSLGMGFDLAEGGEEFATTIVYYMIRRKCDSRVVAGTRVREEIEIEKNVYNDAQPVKKVEERIVNWLKDVSPWMKEHHNEGDGGWKVEISWMGIMGFTPDLYPLAGRWSENEFLACGFSGDGMARCFAVAKGIAEMIVEGKEKKGAKVRLPRTFSPQRFFRNGGKKAKF